MKLTKSEKIWLKLPEDLDPDQTGKVRIRNFGETDDMEIRDKSAPQTLIPDAVKLAALPDNATNEEKFECVRVTRNFSEAEYAFQLCSNRITEWDGFYDPNGNALPLTTTNMRLFVAEKGFFEWVSKMGKLIDKLVAGTLKEEEKNLLNLARVTPEKAA